MDPQGVRKLALPRPNYASWCVNLYEEEEEEDDDEEEDHDDEGPNDGHEDPGVVSDRLDVSLLHPEEEHFYLPRSSPVISRRRKPQSWHGDMGLSVSPSPSSLSVSPSPSSLSVSPSPPTMDMSLGPRESFTTRDPPVSPSTPAMDRSLGLYQSPIATEDLPVSPSSPTMDVSLGPRESFTTRDPPVSPSPPSTKNPQRLRQPPARVPGGLAGRVTPGLVVWSAQGLAGKTKEESSTPCHCASVPSVDRMTKDSDWTNHTCPFPQPHCVSSNHSPPSPQLDKPRSLSANLNRRLTSLLHLPFRGHQEPNQEQGEELDQEQREGLRIRCSSEAHPQSVPDKDKQSSDITHGSANIFKTSCDLDMENAHFIVVDMVLEILEGVKWTVCLGEEGSGADMDHHADMGGLEEQSETLGQHTAEREEGAGQTGGLEDVEHHTHTGGLGEILGAKADPHPPKTLSTVSTDSGFEDCGVISRGSYMSLKSSFRCPMVPCSAEALAQQLVWGFRKQWFPSQKAMRRGRQSLRTSLQELPCPVDMVSDTSSGLREEIKLRTRMRGTFTWAPPRFHIIFTTHPAHRRSEVVASQHFLCAGCGTEIERRYIKKLRYCDYLGKYFCDCCHGGAESVIPGRVLTQWDFGKYSVSDFSKQLLDSVWHQPLFNLTCVGKTLYGKVRELDKFKDLQEQLLCIKKLLAACRLSDGILSEFEQLPGHLTQEPHVFSMEDLLRVKRGQLVPLARTVLRLAITHVEGCQICLARGFFCELCRQKDVLFPFQSDTCSRCPKCKACFHKACFTGGGCPKCARIQSRKHLWKQPA